MPDGVFLPPTIAGKHPVPSNPAVFDARGFGGFGGLGVVQIFVPPGNDSDGTNTVLDDNVRMIQNGTPLTGAQKERYLGWRGFPDFHGILFPDDTGAPVLVPEGGAGDIRPAGSRRRRVTAPPPAPGVVAPRPRRALARLRVL